MLFGNDCLIYPFSRHSFKEIKVTYFKTIRLIPLCEKSNEWPIWIKSFLQWQRIMVQGLFFGNSNKIITKAEENFDVVLYVGKMMTRTIKLNKIEYLKLILSNDVKASYGKIASNVVKRCKSSYYPDGNALTAWEKLNGQFRQEI
jgi:hypothetical protein